MVRCIVACCRKNNINTIGEPITWFNLPKCQAMREIWLKAIGNVKMPRNAAAAKICSTHFAGTLHGEPNFIIWQKSDQRKFRQLTRNAVPTLNLDSQSVEKQESDIPKQPRLKTIVREFVLPVGKKPLPPIRPIEYKTKKKDPQDKLRSTVRREKNVNPATSTSPIPEYEVQISVPESDVELSPHNDLTVVKSRTPFPELEQNFQTTPVPLKDDLDKFPTATSVPKTESLPEPDQDIRMTSVLTNEDLFKLPAETSVPITSTSPFTEDNSPKLNRVPRFFKRRKETGPKLKRRVKTKPMLRAEPIHVETKTNALQLQPKSTDNEEEDSVIGAFVEDVIDDEDPMPYNYYNMIISLKAEIQYHRSTATAYKNTTAEIKNGLEQAEARCAALTFQLVKTEVENTHIISENEKLKKLNQELIAKLASAEEDRIREKKQQRQNVVRSALQPRFTKDQIKRIMEEKKRLKSSSSYFFI